MKPALSLILPANNEAEHLDACLSAVLGSMPLPDDGTAQVIVIPNGCTDDTAEIARRFEKPLNAKGWSLDVIELAVGSKLAALNAGDAAASSEVLVYLDADVIVGPSLLAETVTALAAEAPKYASGKVQVSRAQSWATRAYATFYLQTPFMKQNAPGCGYFAMNRLGRARWADWPAIISDDTFARLNFTPEERIEVDAAYEWPLVEGVANLIKVRRRQNAGVTELAMKFPELKKNDAKLEFTSMAVLKAVLRHPIGTLVYGLVSAMVKLKPKNDGDWKRGR